MAILVFPSCLESSVKFASEAKRWNGRVIGASSLDLDSYAAEYDAWEKLPFIGEPAFLDALEVIVERHAVSSVFTPHAPTYSFLETQLPSRLPNLKLVGDGPFKMEMNRVSGLLRQGEIDLVAVARHSFVRDQLPVQFLAGLMACTEALHGECSREKVIGLCAAASLTPKGDVVEIGSLYGKSTYVLNRLATYFGIGATLAVDPWRLDLTIQHDAPRAIQDASRGWDWETVYQGFLINMLAHGAPPLNYIRAPSAEAHIVYTSGQPVISREFGITMLHGSIAMLHIDGNHDEVAVAEDFELWSRRLEPGGWVVFDDYNWPHGDGPRRVADRAVSAYGSRLTRRFLAGGALFIRVGE